MIGIVLLAIASAVVVAFERGDCFIDYSIGETHEYFFDSSLNVDHQFEHQEGQSTLSKTYNKQLLADVTLVGVDEDAQLFHFELNIVDAEWSFDGGVETFRRAGDGRLPIEQSALNAAYLRAHRRAFYYTQACNGEIVSVFHPADEPASVVTTKKMFINQLSHRAHGDASSSKQQKRAASPSSHVVAERDNHGVRDTTYSYERKRSAADDADELHVRKEFDTVRTFRPPPELRQTGDALNTWRARTAEQQLTTLRDGVVHRIERRSQLDFPPNAAAYRASAGRRDAPAAKRDVDAAAASAAADADASEEARQLNEQLGKLKGSSFWLRARANSQLDHKGRSRKRAAFAASFEAEHLGANFLHHLSKRHETEFKSDTSHNLDTEQLPGPGSVADTLDMLLADKAPVEASIQLNLLLHHDKANTLKAIVPLLPGTAPTSDAARARLFRILAEVGTEEEQAVLRSIAQNVDEQLSVRLRVLTALRGVMKPTQATLDLVRSFMQIEQIDDAGANAVAVALRKSATLMLGVLAENINATNVDLARSIRLELLERLIFAKTEDERHVFVAALDNAYDHAAPHDDVLLDRIALGHELVAKYARLQEDRRFTRYFLPSAMVDGHVDDHKRIFVNPPATFTNDTVSCESGSNKLLRTLFVDRNDGVTRCRPCADQNNPACRNCVSKVFRTNEDCPPPRCRDPMNLMCGNGTDVTAQMVDAAGNPCNSNGQDRDGNPCMMNECADCTDCRDKDGRACGSMCQMASGGACPEPPNWFTEQIVMFFGEDKCMGVERFAQCQATIGKMYNDLRPLKPDYQWAKRIGGDPVCGKIEAILDAATTDDNTLRPCGQNERPFMTRDSTCAPANEIAFKVFAGAWAGLEAYEKSDTYVFNPNAARLEVASAYLQVKSSVAKFWQTMPPDPAHAANSANGTDSTRPQAESICDKPVEFALYYNFAGKTYYHETTKDLIDDKMGKSTCFLVNQTCSPMKPPERAWLTSATDLYNRYLPDLLGDFDLGGIPLKLELIVNSQARVHHAISYQYSELEGGLLLNGYVEPQADCEVSMSATISWGANFGNTPEAGKAQEMRNLIKVGIMAHIEVFKVMFPAIGAVNFETSKPCASVQLQTRALGGRVDVVLEIMGINVLQFLGGLFGVKQTLYEWKGLSFDIPFFNSKCCKLCPGSCQQQTLEKDKVNGAHSRCDFTKGECVCTPGWDGNECMIPCPESCDTNVGILCDRSKNFTVGGGRFAPRGRCQCEAGSWGYDCSLACPGGRKNPCNKKTDTTTTWKGVTNVTCKSDGTCDCWDFPPKGPWFGPRCDITCGDPTMLAPANDPDFTRCGKVGVSRAECIYDELLMTAECKCLRNWYGPKCDQICPLTADDRKAPCSLRGECNEIGGKAVCLCDLGFYGETCEFISFTGSGLALAFDGKDMSAKAEYPLTPTQLSTSAGDGYTIMGWFQAIALPTGARGVSLVKWRWGDVRLQSDGSVGLCDTGSCAKSTSKATAGNDEKSWYWFAAAMQNSNSGAGTRKVWLAKYDDLMPAPFSDTTALADAGGASVLLGSDGFNGLIDHVHIINRVATETDLVNYRVGTVAASTPGVVFQTLCDEGRADHVYAEMPFVAGPKSPSVKWVRSFAPLQWATLNSDIAPPLKVFDPKKPALRSYALLFDGKRIIKGFLAYKITSPMTPGKKRVLTECKISVALADPTVPVKTYGDNGKPLTDDQLRAADTRKRIPLVTDMLVSGDGSMKDPIPLSMEALQQLRSGVIDIEFSMSMDNPPACLSKSTPLIVTGSFITLQVAQVDGIAQTLGLTDGFLSITPTAPLKGTWSLEMWVYVETLRQFSASVADSALAMLYQTGKQVDLVNTKPSFAIFLLGQTDRGVRTEFASGGVLNQYGYDLSTKRGDWFHVMFTSELSGSMCTSKLYVDGYLTGTPMPAVSCGDGTVANWGNSAYQLRIGSKFEGRFNDIILRTGAISAASTMQLVKNMKAPDVVFGFSLDDRSMAVQSGSTTLMDDSGKTTGVRLVQGVIRGMIYGAVHRWKLCPGIDDVTNPERVCGNTMIQERGTCFVEDEENEGVHQLSYKCKCNEGFAGKACQKQCLGAVSIGGKTVLCSGHGKCVTTTEADDVMCNCDPGFAGDGCQYTCPGWDVSNPPGQQVCHGGGLCKLNAARTGAVCTCNAASGRYGLSCEYVQNKNPLVSCDECIAGEECVDGTCDCVFPYFRVGDACQKAANAHTIRLSLALLASIVVANFLLL